MTIRRAHLSPDHAEDERFEQLGELNDGEQRFEAGVR